MTAAESTIDLERIARCAALLLLALVATLSTSAQKAKVPKVAVMFWRIPAADLSGQPPRLPGARVFVESLAERGWVHGKTVEIIWRTAEGDAIRMEKTFAELVAAPVDVIAISGAENISRSVAKARTVPIVLILSADPVAAGFVGSLSRSGGHITGLQTSASAGLLGKRIALLKQAAPQVTKVAYLLDRLDMAVGEMGERERAARESGITLLPYAVETYDQLAHAMTDAIAKGANGMYVATSLAAAAKDQPAFNVIAQKHRLPTMHLFVSAVRSGGLMYYGSRPGDTYRRSADYIDRILRGSKPADMAVEQPTNFHLVVNLKAARALGLVMPAALLSQADEVLE